MDTSFHKLTLMEKRQMYGPTLAFCDAIHAEKYRGPGEGFSEAMSRVASALKDNEEHFKQFREILLNQRFLPAGRIQSAMGAARRVTPYNCYVSGTIDDSLVKGGGSITKRFEEALLTMQMGGGIGYDFSGLRPKGSPIRSLDSSSSGPISFMDIFDAGCRTISSAGHRRGAQMAVMRIDHPDIRDFIHAKQNTYRFKAFNISIAVTDKFMTCLATGKPFKLEWGGKVYDEINPEELWEMVMRSTWDWAEPGVIFIDTINKMNNLYYCEEIAATNPCGEQPLPPFGACLLGSQNLVKYITPDPNPEFDWELFQRDIPIIHAGMDNVIDRAIYPLREQEIEALSKRRMGMGITGLANAAERLGMPYGSFAFIEFEKKILHAQLNGFYQASAIRAGKHGSFPMYDAEKYLTGRFVNNGNLTEETLYLMRTYGMRNSHLTSIAPTGTISLTADNISSGLEPVIALEQTRLVRSGLDEQQEIRLPDYAFAKWGVKGKTIEEVTANEHVNVLIAAASYIDSAISKTCNVPGDTPWEDFKNLYRIAWEGGAKGCTTYQTDGERSAIIKKADNTPSELEKLKAMQEAWTCEIDENGRRECG